MSKYFRQLLFESFLATILVFIVVWLLFMTLNISFKPLNFLAKSLKNINLTDLYMGHIKTQEVDRDIIIVNISDINRCEQAILIDRIAQQEPAVIGIDVLFSKDSSAVNYTDTLCFFSDGTEQVKTAIERHSDKVVQAILWDPASQKISDQCLHFGNVTGGNINLETNKDRTEPVRFFTPYTIYGQDTLMSFAYAVIKKVDPARIMSAMQRKHKSEMINYSGNSNAFVTIDAREMLRDPATFADKLRDKIVLVGVTGDLGYGGKRDDLSDMYYTPMNEKFIGRSLPDMYGVMVHANIISMIRHDQFIHRGSGWLFALIAFLITYLHVVPFIHFFVKQHLWYHVFAKLFQLVSLFVITWMLFWLLEDFRISVNIKYLFIAIFVSVDVLYLYEALVAIVYRKWHRKSIFIHEH